MTFISRFLRRFSAHKRGNVIVVFALSLPIIAGAVGGGIDFTNVYNSRARLQDAADSAAIAAALNSAGTSDTQTAVAKQAFCANIAVTTGDANSYCGNKVGFNLGSAQGALKITTANNVQTMNYVATAQVPTVMLKMLNINTIAISATANAGVSINSAEIVFVLDNTGSMASNNKMTALKSSLISTLNSLLDSNGNNTGKTKVALVPFDTQVALSNVSSMSSYTGSYTTVTPVYTCTSTLTTAQCNSAGANMTSMCAHFSSTSDQATCTSNARIYVRSNNGKYYVYASSYVPNNNYYNNNYTTIESSSVYSVSGTTYTLMSGYPNWDYNTSSSKYPYGAPNNYTQYTGGISYAVPSSGGYSSGSSTVIKDNNTITANSDLLGVSSGTWTGCVIDRAQSYDVTSDAPVASNANTLYPAAKCATNSLLPIMDLTTDIAAVKTYSNGMTPAGNTNITIGIQWGMEVLSPTAPFTSGAAFTDKTVNKYMIVLTDGLNTQNRWTTTAADINARTALACTNAKALGITVFTIRLQDGDSTMLSNCASNTGYYYNLSSSTQINGALGSIMKSIKKIRLTQ